MSDWFQIAYQIIALSAVVLLLLPGVFLTISLGVSGLHRLAYLVKDELVHIAGVKEE